MMRLLFRLARVYWRLTRPVHLGVKGIVIEDGRVLLVRTTYGGPRWDFPGGHVHRGESAEEAVVREIREESGVEVEPARLVGVDYVTRYKHDHVLVFECRVKHRGSPTRSAEIADCGFYPLENLPGVRQTTQRWITALTQ
jgi:ADP-ribose pyrophosphatase YjhB (NUDIX family)